MKFCSIYLLMTFLLSFSAVGDEAVSADSAMLAQASLPLCVESPQVISKIQNVIKANSKTDKKYNGYRDALSSSSDLELVARLVYSETLAANCPELSNQISPLIASAVVNRVKLRRADVRGVIFQRDQFSSSLNNYSESHYRDFLCPKDTKLWNQIITQVKLAMTTGQESSKISPDTVNYFLYKHSPKWTKEPWSLEEDNLNTPPETRECIRFFHNPSWK